MNVWFEFSESHLPRSMGDSELQRPSFLHQRQQQGCETGRCFKESKGRRNEEGKMLLRRLSDSVVLATVFRVTYF